MATKKKTTKKKATKTRAAVVAAPPQGHTPSEMIPLEFIAMVPGDAPKRFDILKNYRSLNRPDDDAQFTLHLRKEGLLQPIGIAPKPRGLNLPEQVRYIVVWGNRRFQAYTAWLEKAIRAEHQREVVAAKDRAAEIGGAAYDKKAMADKLRRRLSEMPTHIQAVLINEQDPLLIAARNFQENAARENPHWTDTASRAVMLSDAAKKNAGKNGYSKKAGDGRWVGEHLGLSKSMANNYLRCARMLSPKLWDLARRDDGVLPAGLAIRLAGVSKDAPEKDRHAAQWREFERQTGTGDAAEKAAEPKIDRQPRPGLDELESKLADVASGGYAEKTPAKVPKGSADFKTGFTDGYSAGFNEALLIALRYATGKRKSFPKAGGSR